MTAPKDSLAFIPAIAGKDRLARTSVWVILLLLAIFIGSPLKRPASSSQSEVNNSRIFLPQISRSFSVLCPDLETTGGADGIPSWGSAIAISPIDDEVWVVNPDSGSISVVDLESLAVLKEIEVGYEPWSIAFSPDGLRLYVLDRRAGKLDVVNVQDSGICASIPVGPHPGHLALSPDGRTLYVTITNEDEVAVIDASSITITTRIPVSARPYAISVSDDGDGESGDERLYITHRFAFPIAGVTQGSDDSSLGRLTVISAESLEEIGLIDLDPDSHGFPNLLSSITLFENRAWVPHVRAAPDLPNGLTTKVFAAVSELDLDQNEENFEARLLLNDQEIFGSPVNNPVAAVPSPDGQLLYVVLAGSNLVEVIDITIPGQPRLVRFLPTGSNPRGMALSLDGRRGYVMNYLSRSVTVLDLEHLEAIGEISATGETLDSQVLRGKILFNTAANPRMSQGSWISCASCHPDGGTDGVTWLLPDGPRQTPPLWNAAETLPWHWSATLDEAQDVEETIQDLQLGLGLAPGYDPPLLGQTNAGRSADLDALAAFLERGIYAPSGPRISGDVSPGRALFQSAGCPTCHGGPTWTSSSLPGSVGTLDPDGNGSIDSVLEDVGTLNLLDVRGQDGFDPPSLFGIGLSAPYLHDGTMPTLEALLDSGHPDPGGEGNGLDDLEKAALVRFLHSIGSDTQPLLDLSQ